MPAFCHRCGAQVHPEARFCGACGGSVTAPGHPGLASTHFTTQLTNPRKPKVRRSLKFVFGISLVLFVLVLVATSSNDKKTVSNTQPAPTSTEPQTSSSANTEQTEDRPLDYSKAVFTKYGAVVCPIGLLSDPREDHSPDKVAEMFTSIWNKDDKAKALGCTELQEGVPVKATKFGDEMASISLPGTGVEGLFTMEDELTNGVPGQSEAKKAELATPHINSQPETSAQTIVPPNSPGALLITIPSHNPIPSGNVVVKAELGGFGAAVCPNTNVFAAWINVETSSHSQTDESADDAGDTDSDGITQLVQLGCSYFPPGTPMIVKGANQYHSLAVVDVKTQDGNAVEGVTFPSSLVPAEELHSRAQPQ